MLPTSQVLSGQYATPAAGANSVGTQTVQLYDATTNDLISTQQFSLNPSTIIWSPLIPYNGATNGTNLNDTFATDGLLGAPGGGASIVQEQSVQGLFYQASGVISGHVYRLTISNGNGVVLSCDDHGREPHVRLAAGILGAVPVHRAELVHRCAAARVPDQRRELHVVRRDADAVRPQRLHRAALRHGDRRGRRLQVVPGRLVRRASSSGRTRPGPT